MKTLFYCIDCKKDIVHDTSEERFLMACPFCHCTESLYHFDEKDTKLLKGKRIDRIFHNEWTYVSRLIIFEDGTHGIMEKVDSETIDFRLLEGNEDER